MAIDGGDMTVKKDLVQRALDTIASCTEPDLLRTIAKNAKDKGEDGVAHAAELRLYAILPSASLGTLAYDVWQSIYALEGTLKAERGKTVLLARTRQKIARDGERGTVEALVLGKESDGFKMLTDRGMPELTFELVAMRHEQEFSGEVIAAAEKRLRSAGYDPAELLEK